MTNLSHWIYAKDFTAHEAAYLILGVDPSTDTDGRSARHIKERLQDAYAGELEYLEFLIFLAPSLPDGLDEMLPRLGKHERLQSVAMESLLNQYETEGDEVSINAWLERGRNNFFEQRFSRVELARWIHDNQLVSMYPFAHDASLQSQEKGEKPPMQKPLSNRERDILLTIIAALCKEAKLDHTKHAKTAGMIQSTAAGMGVSIGESTIEGHLKKIPNALAGRMK